MIRKSSFFTFLPLYYLFIPRYVNIPINIGFNIDFAKIFALGIFSIYILFILSFGIRIVKKITIVYVVYIFLLFVSVFLSHNVGYSLIYFITDFIFIYSFYFYGLNSQSLINERIEKKFHILVFFLIIYVFFEYVFEFNPIIYYNIITDSKTFGENTLNLYKSLGFVCSAWYGNSLISGQIFYFIFIYIFYFYVSNPTLKKLIFVLLIILLILSTQSKSTLLFLLLFFVLYTLFANIRNAIILKPILIFVISLLFIFFIFTFKDLIITTFIEGNKHTSTAMRIYGVIKSFEILEHNSLGIGYATLSKLNLSDNIILETYIDQRFDFLLFLKIAIESSVFSFLLLVFIYFYAVILSYRIYKINKTNQNVIMILFFILYPLNITTTTSNEALFLYFFILGNFIKNKNFLLIKENYK